MHGHHDGVSLELESKLDNPLSRELLRLPSDAQTAVRILLGRDMFGKVELLEPMNFELPSLEATALPPAVGTLAQCFDVANLGEAEWNARAIGAEVYTPATAVDLPGFGWRHAAIVRVPGSGALALLYQRPA